MRIELFLAVQSLRRSWIVTSLMIVATAAGVGFQIPTAAFIDGYADELIAQVVLREFGHVHVIADGAAPIEHATALQAQLATLPHVRDVGRRLIHAGAVQRGGTFEPVRIVGVDPTGEEASSGFCSRVAHGRCFGIDEPDAVIVGSQLAGQLHVAAGDSLRLVLPYDDLGDVGLSSRTYRIVGVLTGGGIWQADEDLYAPIGFLTGLLDAPDTANRLAVFVDPIDETQSVTDAVRGVLATADVGRATALPWWEAHRFVGNAIETNDRIGLVSALTVALAVLVPVLALLYIHVLGERRELGVLVAMGFRARAIFRVVALKGALVSLVGTALGALLGAGACWAAREWPLYTEGGFILRPTLSLAVVAVPAAIIGATTLLAGLIPAWLTTKQDPALVLRGDQ